MDLSDLIPRMKKREFQEKLRSLVQNQVEGYSWEEKMALVKNELFKLDKEFNDTPENKGQPWTDDEIRLVLSISPTSDNICTLAKALKRGHGSIEQVYRWAGQSPDRIKSERPDDAFVQRIEKIRKEVGWRSIGGNK
ncbi:TPA: hypothetical protein ACMDQX_001687 [Vibrio cholerae]